MGCEEKGIWSIGGLYMHMDQGEKEWWYEQSFRSLDWESHGSKERKYSGGKRDEPT